MRPRIRDKVLNATAIIAALGHVARARPLTGTEHDTMRLKLKQIEESIDCTVTWKDVKCFFTRRVF